MNILIGPNGAGKTTLVKAILGLIPYTGEIEHCLSPENNPSEGAKIAYVPQKLQFDPNMPLTVKDFMCLPQQHLPVWLGHSKKAVTQSKDVLKKLQVEHLINRPLGKLSGGEFQRILLAMALQCKPHAIFLDEPAAGVDIAGEEIFYELLMQLQKEHGFTLLIVSHDLSLIPKHAEHVICLNKTVCCEGDSTFALTPENLATIYGTHIGIYQHIHTENTEH